MQDSEPHSPLRPRKSKVKKSEALWLMTFSDLSFVLLCFFILMFSYSSPDSKKFDNVRQGMTAKASNVEPRAEISDSLKSIEQEIQKLITENKLEHVAQVTFDTAGVAVEFKDHALFKSGSARVQAENEELISQVLKAIAATPERYKLEVEGHTDDLPIHTRRFRDNWDLSAARAISLLHRFQTEGVASERISVQAFANTRPKVPLHDKKGEALHAARAHNRRVVIRIR